MSASPEQPALLPPLPATLTSEPTCRASLLGEQSSVLRSSCSACGENESSSGSPAPQARHLGGRASGRAGERGRGGACLKGVGAQVLLLFWESTLRVDLCPDAPRSTDPPTHPASHSSIHARTQHAPGSSLRLGLRDRGTLSPGFRGEATFLPAPPRWQVN